MIPNKRTLTLKSKLGFGEHFDKTIDQILKANKKSYLAWVYYHNEIIDFIQEIKDSIGINKDIEISKPGRDPNLYGNIKHMFYETYVHNDISEISMEKQKILNKAVKKNHNKVSKIELARKNQGKI